MNQVFIYLLIFLQSLLTSAMASDTSSQKSSGLGSLDFNSVSEIVQKRERKDALKSFL